MYLDLQAGKSPLESREDPIIYIVILIGLIGIGLAVLIWFGLKYLEKLHSSAKYIENQRHKITQIKDVKRLAQQFHIPKEQTSLLWKICNKLKIPNIIYSVKNIDELDVYLKQFYEKFKKDASAKEINLFFSLRFTLEKICSSFSIIKSTKGLPEKSIIYLITKDSIKIDFTITKNVNDYMIIEPEEKFYKLSERPEPLAKLIFSMMSKTKMHYGFVTRIIRYQKKEDEKVELVIAHPNELHTQTKRKSLRYFNKRPVNFSAAALNSETKKFTAAEKKYEGTVTNISTGGCCLCSNLPIKKDQFIYIDLSSFQINEPVYGKIVNTRNTLTEGLYNLHIQFNNISFETANTINILAFNY